MDLMEMFIAAAIVFIMTMYGYAAGKDNPYPLHIEQINSAIEICADANSELEYIQGKTVKCKNGLSKEQPND